MSETTDFLFDIRKELDRHKAGGYQFSKKLTLTRQNPSATIMSTEDISATAKYIIENVMIDVHGERHGQELSQSFRLAME